jgi:hypothetical protein
MEELVLAVTLSQPHVLPAEGFQPHCHVIRPKRHQLPRSHLHRCSNQLLVRETTNDELRANSFALQLIGFNDQRIRQRPGVFPSPGNLPADALSRIRAAEGETIPDQLFLHMECWSRRADWGELVSEILVQRVEVRWELDYSLARRISSGNSIIDIFHVRRFDEGMN